MSKVILSSVLLNVRNVRNFSAVACTKKWDLPSGSRPCVAIKQHWSLPLKKSSPPFNYFNSTTTRWCSTGSVPPDLGALSNSIPPAPNEATRHIFENLPNIPAPPEILPPVEKIVELAKNGEPTLQSIGLGGWWPKGIFEETLMAIHVNLGLPWWGTIMLGACVMRCILFPISVKSQRASGKLALYMPQITEAHEKMTEARRLNDPYLVYKYARQVEELQKNGASPLTSVKYAVMQMPFIFCFFSALREMSTTPVESFKTGGILWFTDLTTTDPYYGLPIMCSIGLFSVFQLSSDAFAATKWGPYLPYVAAPCSFFVCMFFTNAVGVYWVTASVLNYIQAVILRNPNIRVKLDLPPRNTNLLPTTKKKKNSEGFVKDFKKNMENNRIAREVDDRFRLDAIAFEKAGKEPLKKTFKIDPTKTSLKA